MRSEFKEGKWLCIAIDSYTNKPCNHENPGPAPECQKCFHPRPQDVKFYLPDDARTVSDQKTIDRANEGADWVCVYCSHNNRASEEFCGQCHEIRREDDPQWKDLGGSVKTKQYSNGQAPKQGIIAPQKSATQGRMPWLKWGAIVAVVLVVLWGIGQLFFGSEIVKVKTASFSWERKVSIEKLKMVKESGWSIPSGSREIKREQRQKDTQKVYSHSEWIDEPVYQKVASGTEEYECGVIDKGNGYFEKKICTRPKYIQKKTGSKKVEKKHYTDKPIFAPYYTYEIQKWRHDRTLEAAAKDQRPAWPKYNLGKRERVAKKQEKYILHLSDISTNESYSYEMPESAWKQVKKNQQFQAEISALGAVRSLQALP